LNFAPDGYFIRNANTKIRSFLISDKSIFIIQPRSGEVKWNKVVSRKEFIDYVQSKSYMNHVPFHIELKNGVVTKITEQYIP
jgi:hypothetical protein